VRERDQARARAGPAGDGRLEVAVGLVGRDQVERRAGAAGRDPQRHRQAGVLEGGRDHLVARAPADAPDHHVQADGGVAGEGHVLGTGAEQRPELGAEADLALVGLEGGRDAEPAAGEVARDRPADGGGDAGGERAGAAGVEVDLVRQAGHLGPHG
jgi:hypothetical protein